jgi:tetratricopeptide repeat protein/cytochrome c554/c'-like protein
LSSWLLFASTAIAQPAPGDETGSAVCRGCHAEIYRNYSATGMARSSGRIGSGEFRENLDGGHFSDPNSGADYRITPAAEGYRLEFSRAAAGVRGERILSWFIGSGRVGRSYAFSRDGFLFEAPVSYYSQTAKWDISPGYERLGSIQLTRAVEVACLQCHASRLQPLPGTQNGFRSPPFLENGVGCERCHGPGKEHVARMSAASRSAVKAVVNPAKLDPARRDSVCAQCHLAGAARIARRMAKGDTYRPGRLLSDYSAVFVWSGAESPGMNVNSHFERLPQSKCKAASGDRLWCGTCHDPHSQPPEANKVEYYRERCRKCHAPAACGETREARRAAGDDCTACHMPKRAVRENVHAPYTDHSIPRRPRVPGANSGAAEKRLESFWKTEAGERNLGLAYAAVAGGDRGLEQRAADLLARAAETNPLDLPVLEQLAEMRDRLGNEDAAMRLCERVVRADPTQVTAAINLGVYWMKRGRAREAMRLWEEALKRNPGRTDARINLAVAQYRSGDAAAAERTLRNALEWEPDHLAASSLLQEVRRAQPQQP